MQDELIYRVTGLTQNAKGTITYGTPVQANKASATIEVTNYALLKAAAAIGSITYGIPVDGDTVIVNGNTFTKVAAAPGAGEFSNIAELEALVEAVSGINSSQNGTVVSIVAASTGPAGNAITLALGAENTGTMAISGATLTGGKNADTVVVNGTTLTVDTDFTAETSDAVTAENLKVAVAALDNVTATRAEGIVTVIADAYGAAGNDYTLTSTSEALTINEFSGGADGDTVIVDSNTFTCVISNPQAGEFTSAAQLEALVEAVSGVNSSLADGVITVEAAAVGTAGNAITLALGENNAGTMAISGATLTGGVAATYTDAMEFTGVDNPEQIDAVIDVDTLSSGASVTITPQTSLDKENWIDRTATDSISAAGVTELHTTEPLAYFRYKIVLAGTTPSATLNIKARRSN